MPRKFAYGEPRNIIGACNARIHLADNHGDNHATFVCQLEPEHEGLHEERFSRAGGPVVVQWEVNEEPNYKDCYCHCYDDGVTVECCHKWDGDECSECGMTHEEHDKMIEEIQNDN